MNFLLTCYFLPPCVILYEKTCKLNCCFICAKSKKKQEDGQGQDSERPLKDKTDETDQKTKEPMKEELSERAKNGVAGSGEAPGSALENEPEFKLKEEQQNEGGGFLFEGGSGAKYAVENQKSPSPRLKDLSRNNTF